MNDIFTIARTCHEVNRAYCQTVGDNSQLPWDEAPQWQRDSAVNGVKFAIENPGITPEQSHENWLLEKQQAGWHYGSVKDELTKTHPCMRPYDLLPREQRVKDTLFLAVVKMLLI